MKYRAAFLSVLLAGALWLSAVQPYQLAALSSRP